MFAIDYLMNNKSFFTFFLVIGDPEKQGQLVRQLQEQHYIQYMQQLQAAQRGETQNKIVSVESEKVSTTIFT